VASTRNSRAPVPAGSEPKPQLGDADQTPGTGHSENQRDPHQNHGSAARILLADDHQMVRQGLKILIETQSELRVIAEAEDGWHAVRLAGELMPDIVVMDVAMPHLNGIEATRQILRANAQIKIVGLSMHADKTFVGQMLKAGASAYLLKDSAFMELIQALHAVRADLSYLSPGIAHVVVHDFVRNGNGEPLSTLESLTPREREVLQLIAEGFVTKHIAAQLSLSVKTVESHRQQLMRKLDLHSVAGLTKFALREGVTALDV
jgi:two-component system response regulator NreC